MSAENVWDCMKYYRREAAIAILKLYGHRDRDILTVLNRFPKKGAYMGHASKIGKADAKENASVTKSLLEVRKFLEKNAPGRESSSSSSSSRGPDKAKMAAKKVITKDLKKIIEKEDNLSDLKAALDKENADWINDRATWSAYALKYRAKKGSDPKK